MKTMRLLLSALLLSVTVLGVPIVQADTLTLDFSAVFPTKPGPDSTPPWLTATFEDVSGGVQLTLQANLVGTNFISDIYFNYTDPSKLPFTWTPSTGVSQGTDAFKADGDGWYDFLISLPTSNNDDRFDGTEQLVFTITGDVSALNFEQLSKDAGGAGPFLGAAHVQSISTDPPGSTWIYAEVGGGGGGGGGQVPEPATIVLLGSGLVALGLYGRRFRK